MDHDKTHIIIGIVAGQRAVLAQAATFAEQFDADLVCVSVDSSHYTVNNPDGTVVTMPIDPDLTDDYDVQRFDPDLRASIEAVMENSPIEWSVRALAGGPSVELARVADELDAAMIVVGTRETGFKGTMREFFNGSVAVQLAHHQHRPVVVVPLNPVTVDSDLPWESDE
ncbi:universal stress protein [Rothia uropygialis]|uniref:universal stress protein n=1 Tax=Kocuria sp. 36 TaxID=1415402 RepID=UPI00101DEF73|nr:universal stress protein [Kocuria sp. 36]